MHSSFSLHIPVLKKVLKMSKCTHSDLLLQFQRLAINQLNRSTFGAALSIS